MALLPFEFDFGTFSTMHYLGPHQTVVGLGGISVLTVPLTG